MRSGFFACAVPGLLASPMGEHNDLLSQSAHRPTVPAPQSQLKPAGSRTLQLCPGLAPDSLVQPAHGWALFASPMCHIRRVFAVCSVFSSDYSKKAMAALLDHVVPCLRRRGDLRVALRTEHESSGEEPGATGNMGQNAGVRALLPRSAGCASCRCNRLQASAGRIGGKRKRTEHSSPLFRESCVLSSYGPSRIWYQESPLQ